MQFRVPRSAFCLTDLYFILFIWTENISGCFYYVNTIALCSAKRKRLY